MRLISLPKRVDDQLEGEVGMEFDRPQDRPNGNALLNAAPASFIVTIDGVGHVERAQSLGRLPELRNKLPIGCRRGGCGICRARVLKGNYRSEAMSQEHVPPEDRDVGIVLCCSIFALSDISLRLEPAPKARPRTAVAAGS
jgi:ferredoxin